MTSSEFIAAFPKFDQVDPDDIQRWIDRADGEFDSSTWGTRYSEGLGNYVAHKLIEEGTRGVPVPIDAPRTGAAAGGSWREDVYYLEVESFMRSPFGREYIRLRSIVSKGAVAV